MTNSNKNESLKKRIVTDFPHKTKIIENDWIVLKDGTRLSFRLWLPEDSAQRPVPAILEYIPYRKSDGTRRRDEPMHGYFAGHGYAAIRVDMRGTGESDGLLYDEYLPQEQLDALEVIDWISKQAWCDGNVGMMGKSWGGFNSLQVAALNPPALKAIIVVGFTDDRYNDDIHYKGGCLLNDSFWWGAIMLGYQSRPIDPLFVGDKWMDMWLKRLEEMPFWPSLWMQNQVRNAYWEHGSICQDYNAIKCPVLAFDGWADSYSNTPLRIMEHLRVPRRAIIGPWAHVYPNDGTPEPAIGFLQEAIRWWDHWLKTNDNDAMEPPMIQAWMEDFTPPSSVKLTSPGRWICTDQWPSNDIQDETFYLSYGRLSKIRSDRVEGTQLKSPLTHGLLAGEWMGAGVAGETAPDQRIDDGMASVFDSDVLNEAFEIFGYPYFEIELESDKQTAFLYAQLSDVSPDGAVGRVSYGIINLTHLQGHDKVVYLVPGEKVKVGLKFDCIAHRFPEGHRIRLSLASSHWPTFWPVPEEATLTLSLNTAMLTLPAFHGETCNGPIPQPENALPTPCTTLQEGHVDRLITYDVLKDTWICVTDGVGGVFGEGVYRFDDIDVTVEHNLKRELKLRNGDPLSAQYNIYQKMKIGRQGWVSDTDIVTSMWSDKEYFFIKGSMDVKNNGEIVFRKNWDEKIERHGQ